MRICMWPNTIMQMWGWWSLSRSRVCWFTLISYLAHDGCNPVTCSSRKIYVSTYRSFLTTSGLCRLWAAEYANSTLLSRQVFNHRVHKPTVLIYPLLHDCILSHSWLWSNSMAPPMDSLPRRDLFITASSLWPSVILRPFSPRVILVSI